MRTGDDETERLRAELAAEVARCDALVAAIWRDGGPPTPRIGLAMVEIARARPAGYDYGAGVDQRASGSPPS